MKHRTRKFAGKSFRLAGTKNSRSAARDIAARTRARGGLARVTYDHAPGSTGKVWRIWTRGGGKR